VANNSSQGAVTERLRTDFQLSIITMLGASAIFGISPFAVFRFLEENYIAGIADVIILVGIVSLMIYAWRTGDTARSGFLMALFCCMGGAAISIILTDLGYLWLYPVFVTTFFLTQSRIAIALNTITVILLAIEGSAFTSGETLASFIATSFVVSACAFIFALRNEFQRREMARLARRDALTGVRNRRSMDDALKLAASTADRTGSHYAMAVLDLDHFKHINDNHGHATGDRILMELTELIESNTRQSDQLFRFGGEEFVILMPGVDREGLRAVLLSLRETLRTQLQGPDGTVTASFGAARLEPGEDWESWLKRADDALYQAKENGRDCVVLAN